MLDPPNRNSNYAHAFLSNSIAWSYSNFFELIHFYSFDSVCLAAYAMSKIRMEHYSNNSIFSVNRLVNQSQFLQMFLRLELPVPKFFANFSKPKLVEYRYDSMLTLPKHHSEKIFNSCTIFDGENAKWVCSWFACM